VARRKKEVSGIDRHEIRFKKDETVQFFITKPACEETEPVTFLQCASSYLVPVTTLSDY